jgi:branched-chain amino acid transport system substrate-binding protein
MAITNRSRRFRTPVLATLATLALLAGCGGSDVQDQAGGAAAAETNPNAVTETTTSTVDTPATDAKVAVPAPAANGIPAAAGTETSNAAHPADTTAKTAKADVAAAPGRKATSSTESTGSPVEQMVANAAIFGGKAPCKPATLSPVNIGNVSTLSGVLGELFSPVTPALETFVASQNACGGLNGHKINFFQADDQGDPATAASKAQELIQSKKVIAFTGNIQVLTVDAAMPIYKRFNIPVIGADLTNNTWFTNPIAFPQGSGPQSIAYGYLVGATQYHHVKNVGNIWCIEVPRACEQINRAYVELAPKFGATMKKTIQVSLTAPSYVQQCLEFKNAGVESLAMTIDAASQVRLARSCQQVGWSPKITPYPLSVGNEKQFFGNAWLGNAYVPMNHFPWMDDSTPATKYYQASVRKYNPGFTTGGAASLGWGSGALLVAAAAGLSADNPTTQQLLDTLYTFKGQKFTTLGGLTGPLTFNKGGLPKIPYCLFAAVSNDANTGWKTVISKPTCTDVTAPSDPQNQA